MKKCFNCNKEIDEGSVFCGFCGKKQPEVKYCIKCGQEIGLEDIYCGYCGTSQLVEKKEIRLQEEQRLQSTNQPNEECSLEANTHEINDESNDVESVNVIEDAANEDKRQYESELGGSIDNKNKPQSKKNLIIVLVAIVVIIGGRLLFIPSNENRPYLSGNAKDSIEEFNETGQIIETQKSLTNIFTVVYATSDDGFVNVREQPSSKSKILGQIDVTELGLGALVEKGSEWSKVNKFEEDGSLITGWAYSKYLGTHTWFNEFKKEYLIAIKDDTPIYVDIASFDDCYSKEDGLDLKLFTKVKKGTIIASDYNIKNSYYVLPRVSGVIYVSLYIKKTDAQVNINGSEKEGLKDYIAASPQDKCPKCGGLGGITCPECEGHGMIAADDRSPAYPCEDCGGEFIDGIKYYGTGKIPCPDCNGSGIARRQ